MLCLKCRLRMGCVSPCAALRRDLETIEGGPELIAFPDKAAKLLAAPAYAGELNAHERRVLIGEAIARLGPAQRASVELAVTEQMPPWRVAEATWTPEAGVRKLLEEACWLFSKHFEVEVRPPDLWGHARKRPRSSYLGGENAVSLADAESQKGRHQTELTDFS